MASESSTSIPALNTQDYPSETSATSDDEASSSTLAAAPGAATTSTSTRTRRVHSMDSPKHSYPKSKIKVLVMESISQVAVDAFVREGYQVQTAHRLSSEELKARIRDVHLIGVRSKTKLTADVLHEAKRLLAVGCFCIGTDQTDLEVATTRGIPVFNAPFANTRSVAEMALAEIIMLARQMGDRNTECHSHRWLKRSKGCYEVRGKTLGIIGYGHVGSQLSVLAEACGLRVVYYDTINKLPMGNAQPRESMEAVLRESDFVSMHVPRLPSTHNLITAKEIGMMKRGSYLLNLARGTVVNVDDTAEALRSGHLAGAAFDVFPKEPGSKEEPFESPLCGLPNVILTPHIGGSTEEAQATIGAEVAQKLINFVNNGDTRASVNFPKVYLEPHESTHRILNMHHNVPGVMSEINAALLEYNINAQLLMTQGPVGYLMVEIDKEVSRECYHRLKRTKHHIRTRVLY